MYLVIKSNEVSRDQDTSVAKATSLQVGTWCCCIKAPRMILELLLLMPVSSTIWDSQYKKDDLPYHSQVCAPWSQLIDCDNPQSPGKQSGHTHSGGGEEWAESILTSTNAVQHSNKQKLTCPLRTVLLKVYAIVRRMWGLGWLWNDPGGLVVSGTETFYLCKEVISTFEEGGNFFFEKGTDSKSNMFGNLCFRILY